MADLTSNQVCNVCCIHYNAGLRCCALGSLVEGGYLFAKGGRQAWIVACASSQVSRTWALRADAVTTAQAGNACGDWFIPSRTDLLLAADCKSFWDSFSSTRYWSNTEFNATSAWGACFVGNCINCYTNKTGTYCVRAFRRVSY
jgi:hypothetical protein